LFKSSPYIRMQIDEHVHTHTYRLTNTHTHTHTHTHTNTHTHTRKHTHTHTHTHIHTHTHKRTHNHTLPHPHPHTHNTQVKNENLHDEVKQGKRVRPFLPHHCCTSTDTRTIDHPIQAPKLRYGLSNALLDRFLRIHTCEQLSLWLSTCLSTEIEQQEVQLFQL
jgi:hypothetical protein